MKTVVERFLAEEKDRWAERTLELYRFYVLDFSHWAKKQKIARLEAVTTEDLRCWIGSHGGWGASSRYQAVIVCRSLFRWAVGDAHSPARALRLPRRENAPQQTLTWEQLQAVMANCDTSTAKGTRDAAMISLMADSGVRIGGIVAICMEHLDLASRSLQVRQKGGKWGSAVFGLYTARLLTEWLSVRSQIVTRGVTTVFVGVGGSTPGRPMTRDGIRANFYRIGVQAGIGPLQPHSLRRTFATLSLKAGAPSRLVQVAGGWASLSMVEKYSRALKPADFDGFFPVDRLMGITGRDDLSS